MFSEAPLKGIADLLVRNWEKAKQTGAPARPTIQIGEVRSEAWANGLSDKQALILIQHGLEFEEDWFVGDAMPTEQNP